MAADEGRFGRLGEVRACWCPKGIRPTVAKQQVRQYVYAYAAVAPELGLMTCLILPYANTKMMNLFLGEISREFANYLVVLQLERAAWHRSNCLVIPENIRLILQPAYSPELMPVEHIWEELRENYFYNQLFQSLDQVEDVLSQGLLELCSDPQRLRSLTFFPHLRILPLNAT
jgi:transposase